MKARPVLMSAPMVRALLDGRKAQTRRVVKGEALRWLDTDFGAGFVAMPENRLCPYGVPGDLLWVRETWKPHSLYAGMKPSEMPQAQVFYRADDGYAPSNTPWNPSLFMPRWASRLTLEITEVRVERLQEISEADAIAEGLEWIAPGTWSVAPRLGIVGDDPGQVYSELWDRINGPASWDANPWVWALTFDVHKANVDAVSSQSMREGPKDL